MGRLNPILTLASASVRMDMIAPRTLLPHQRRPRVLQWAAPLGAIREQRQSLQVTSRPAGWMLTIRTCFIWPKRLPMYLTAGVCKADTSTIGQS